jgi:hypothetical protein
MKLAPRESILGIGLLLAILFGFTIILLKPKVQEWKEIRQQSRVLEAVLDKERKLLAGSKDWESQFAELRKMLPAFSADKKMDGHWLATMEQLASGRGLSVLKRQANEEKQNGEVFELVLEGKEWEGTLEALIGFLFDLQNQGATMDVRQLLVRPKERNILKGRFSVNCAYTRLAAGGLPSDGIPEK